MPPYTADYFWRMVLEQFPELREDFAEDEGLLHLQMGSFARRTQQAKGEADWDTYKRCVALAAELWKRPDSPLLNALNVSFLEHIDFNGPRGPIAWGYLSLELRRAWQDMQRYLEDLGARSKNNGTLNGDRQSGRTSARWRHRR